MRWIWIDKFTDFVPRTSARAVKNVSLAEEHLHDLYPDFPVVPHSLVIEGMAQTAGILVGHARDFAEKVILAKIPKARFHGEALAGAELVYEAKLVNLRPEGAVVEGAVTADGRPLAEAEIFFAHLDRNRAQQAFGDHNFVFTGEMQHLLGMARLAAANTPKLPPASPPPTHP